MIELWKHVKTGTVYQYLGLAVDSKTYEPIVLYARRTKGTDALLTIWTRPADEFYDGRFVKITY